MKKMKGVAASMGYSPYPMYEDQRTRFKHQSLMQDFEDLHKETEAMRMKLQMMKEQKLTLLAEVRFLKRRHKFLMQNRSSNTLAGRNFVQPQSTVVKRSKSNVKEKKSTGKEHSLRHLAMGFDLNQKGKTYSEKETTFTHHSLIFDLNQKQHKNINGEEVILRSSSPILDLNQRERLYSGKEATARTMTPIFDLNQISVREEEELQAMDNSMRIEEFKKSSIRMASDEQHNDIKISACRNTGNGPNRVGKRKISWQDQVALRV
ncbi:hypothetical protein Gogos_019906 [Gossypium gossypioides]|uniref:Uncharacterized protein n=1 Tax=Gossypium gossypioides TaxID=34282 RepID=A0A7J9CZT9_GOSGO|nr:hypothetical protein [Gossypium gossypioides]